MLNGTGLSLGSGGGSRAGGPGASAAARCAGGPSVATNIGWTSAHDIRVSAVGRMIAGAVVVSDTDCGPCVDDPNASAMKRRAGDAMVVLRLA